MLNRACNMMESSDLNSFHLISPLGSVSDKDTSASDERRFLRKFGMQIVLRSLPKSAFFNIYFFGGSHFDTLFLEASSRRFTFENFQQAYYFTDHHVTADIAGGTGDLLQPLQKVFSQPPQPGLSRQVFVLTYGETIAQKSQAVIDLIGLNAAAGNNSTRVFALGLGDSNPGNRALVSEIAAAGKGQAEFIPSRKELERRVERQLSRALKPVAITDAAITVTFNNVANPEQVPKVLPSNLKVRIDD